MKLKVLRKAKSWLEDRDFGGWVKSRRTEVARSLAPYFTANQLTIVFGLLACIPITYFYAIGMYWPASILLTISLLSDFADGSIAHFQQGSMPAMTLEQERLLTIRERIGFRGVTHLGKVLDPLVDKIRFFCVLYVLGWGVVSTWLIISLTIVAALLTLARPVKYWFKVGDGRSNRLGQLKVWAEVLAIAALVFVPDMTTLGKTALGLALTFGVFSLGGHVLSMVAALASRRQRRKQKRRSIGHHLQAVRTREP